MRRCQEPEYKAWQNMKSRCLNRRHPSYKDYGARGIGVSLQWLDHYLTFLADVGRRPSPKHSLDRVDNNGNYEPGNVRWATRIVQNRNSRHVRAITWRGETLPLRVWADRLQLRYGTLKGRLDRGWTVDAALGSPRQGSPRGSRNGQAHLTEPEVLDLRRFYRSGFFTQETLAAMFGIAPMTVSSIVRRRLWAHLGRGL